MAKKKDRKKQKKRKKEAHKAEKRAARDEFPRVEIVFDGEDEEFMLAVEEIIHTFDYANDEHCPEIARDAYKLLRKVGIEQLRRAWDNPDRFNDAQYGQNAAAYVKQLMFELRYHFGSWVFAKLPTHYTAAPLPYYHFEVVPKGNGLVVAFKFLPSKQIGTQKVWHSSFEPAVEISGKSYAVGLTRHVFEQACKRILLTEPFDYLQLYLVAGYFRHCVYFEHVHLPNGEDALRLFYPCDPVFESVYLAEIAQLSKAQMEAGNWSFLFGYCPVVLDESGYAIAKTMLFPGYTNTPEAELVERTRMNPALRLELQKAAHKNTLGRVMLEETRKAVRWYHHNGVPQVVQLTKPLFGTG